MAVAITNKHFSILYQLFTFIQLVLSLTCNTLTIQYLATLIKSSNSTSEQHIWAILFMNLLVMLEMILVACWGLSLWRGTISFHSNFSSHSEKKLKTCSILGLVAHSLQTLFGIIISYIASCSLLYGNLWQQGSEWYSKMQALPLVVALGHEAFSVMCWGVSIWNVIFVWRECKRNEHVTTMTIGDEEMSPPHVRLEEEEEEH
ncbi:hypothetical protein C9374_005709 [Naegleria lovaniensis]|uniref:Transmembrane protein n=1 Tax=Naegleria lovaniensis TaxID=51637 RepID=A0AA88KI79_NAELO|nr:uncharacterized protein C9374_005709 [Naegleria lovaniensis]KAG2381917.1 hypothetical protein C9374_005709 [Naegleria lovaniensis]